MIRRLAAGIAFCTLLFTIGCQIESLNGVEESSAKPLYKSAAFGGVIKNVRIKQQVGGPGYIMTGHVDGAPEDIEQISSLEVLFNEPINGPAPIENPLTLDCFSSTGSGGIPNARVCTVWIAESELDANAIGQTYNVTATMFDVDHIVIGDQLIMDVTVESLDGDEIVDVKINDVEIVNLGGGIFQVRVNQEGVDLSSTSGILLSTAGALIRLRQRPDLLVSEWDELIDQNLQMLQDNPLYKPSSILSGETLSPGTVIPLTAVFVVENSDGFLEVIECGKLETEVIIPDEKIFANSAKIRGRRLTQVDLKMEDGSIYGGVKPDVVAPGVSVVSIWKVNFNPNGTAATGIGIHVNGEETLNCNYDPIGANPKIDFWNCLNDGLEAKPGNNTIAFGQASVISSKRTRILVIPYGDDGSVVGKKKWIKVKVSKPKAFLKINYSRFRMMGDNTISMGPTFTFQPGARKWNKQPFTSIRFKCGALGLKPIAFRNKHSKRNYYRYGLCDLNLPHNLKSKTNSDGTATMSFPTFITTSVSAADWAPPENGINFHIRGGKNPLGNVQNSKPEQEDNPYIGEISASYTFDVKKKGSFFLSVQVSGKSALVVERVGIVLAPTKRNTPNANACEYNGDGANPRVDFWNCLSDGLEAVEGDVDGSSGSLIFPNRAGGREYQPLLVGYDNLGNSLFSHLTGPPIVLPDPKINDADYRRRCKRRHGRLKHKAQAIRVEIQIQKNAS